MLMAKYLFQNIHFQRVKRALISSQVGISRSRDALRGKPLEDVKDLSPKEIETLLSTEVADRARMELGVMGIWDMKDTS